MEERQIDRSEVYLADEAFYCGTGAQVCPSAPSITGPLDRVKSARW
ncbi:MAG: hypothetical protein R2873_30460 [Caldilineaceae bacterium]